MTTYVSLMSYTEKGLGAIGRSPDRLDEAKAVLAEMGGSFVNFYMTMGVHDAVLVYEAPDDATSARFQLMLGAKGFVRTTTMKAFPEAAFREIVRTV